MFHVSQQETEIMQWSNKQCLQLIRKRTVSHATGTVTLSIIAKTAHSFQYIASIHRDQPQNSQRLYQQTIATHTIRKTVKKNVYKMHIKEQQVLHSCKIHKQTTTHNLTQNNQKNKTTTST